MAFIRTSVWHNVVGSNRKGFLSPRVMMTGSIINGILLRSLGSLSLRLILFSRHPGRPGRISPSTNGRIPSVFGPRNTNITLVINRTIRTRETRWVVIPFSFFMTTITAKLWHNKENKQVKIGKDSLWIDSPNIQKIQKKELNPKTECEYTTNNHCGSTTWQPMEEKGEDNADGNRFYGEQKRN